jgi:hypothetical protein
MRELKLRGSWDVYAYHNMAIITDLVQLKVGRKKRNRGKHTHGSGTRAIPRDLIPDVFSNNPVRGKHIVKGG